VSNHRELPGIIGKICAAGNVLHIAEPSIRELGMSSAQTALNVLERSDVPVGQQVRRQWRTAGSHAVTGPSVVQEPPSDGLGCVERKSACFTSSGPSSWDSSPASSPGRSGADHMGLLATTVVGIVGSVIGGFIGRLIKRPEPGTTFHPAGFLMSIVGAVVLLFVLRLVG
jgi:uncharacterized membrane protein YeaQ/YmgE (transglycosylase-associated protein family)